MKTSNFLKKTLPIIIIFSCGFFIRILIAINSSLSLDENFSLYFADFFSFQQLLFFFQNDIQPGGYYAILKSLLLLTKNKTLLIFLSSSLIELTGIGLYFIHSIQKKRSQFFLLMLAMLLLINPFIVATTTQVRMYGFVVAASLINLILLERWLVKFTPKYFFGLCLTLFLSLYISYSFFFLIIGISLYIQFYVKMKRKIKYQHVAILFSVFLIQFFLARGVSSGSDFQAQFNHFSWVSEPTISNSLSIPFTSYGLLTDLNNNHNNTNIIIMLVAICLGLFTFYSKNLFYILKEKHKITKRLLFIVAIPSFSIICLSIFSPILTTMPFFYRYSLQVSLLLPRVFLPLTIVGYVYSTLLISSMSIRNKSFLSKIILKLVIGSILIFWMNSYNEYLSKNWIENYNTSFLQSKVSIENVYVWPNFVWYTIIDSNQISSGMINNNIKNKTINQNKLNEVNRSECAYLRKKEIYVLMNVTDNLKNDQQNLLKKTSYCCNVTQYNSSFYLASCSSD